MMLQSENKSSKNAVSREFLLGQLLAEYERRSNTLLKAIDNSYVILGFTFSSLAGLVLLSGSQVHPVFQGVVPFVVLCLIFVDSHVRTTILTNTKYIVFLEKWINKEMGFPLLLWESKVAPGNIFYYRFTRYAVLRSLALSAFLSVAGSAYLFPLYSFAKYLQTASTLQIYSVVLDLKLLSIVYYFVLGITTISGVMSWLLSYLVQPRVYEGFVNEKAQKAILEFEYPESTHS